MKWLVLSLVILNLALWLLPERLALTSVSSAAEGGLPRVANLKVEESGPVAPESNAVCLTVGWFKSPAVAHRIGRTANVEYRVESRKAPLPPMHWVLVPAQRESDARAQADALREKGDDVYVVAKGQFKNAISLGVFESAEAANKLAAKKSQKKLSVTLAKFPRNRIGYALAFKVEPLRETEVLQAVEAGFDGDFDFVERNACEGVATSEKNP